MPSRLRAIVIVIAAVCAGVAVPAQAPSAILLEQRQREVVLVRHLRQHVADPGDGLALSADRRDLQRLRSAVPSPATTLPPTATDEALLDSLRILVDVWHGRIVDRTPFGLMPRERLAGLSQVQRAVAQRQSRGGRTGLDVWLPVVEHELTALVQAANGEGAVSDAALTVALTVADAAGTGLGSGPAPRPLSGGPTPYTLPPAYEAYSGAAAAGVGGVAACQTLRSAAGVSQRVNDMIRAADCWTRTPTWPGWAAQSLEALDWATGLAAAEHNCAALGTAIDALREIGPRLSAGGLASEVATLVRQAESDRRRLRGQSLCR